MGAFAAGEVILLPFPFSDLARNKIRPALLLAEATRGDWIVCQITSNPYADPTAIPLADTDFTTGGLQRLSHIRPTKVFTANATLFLAIAGTVNHQTLTAARATLIQALSA
jgi:mRNA interferase MazF